MDWSDQSKREITEQDVDILNHLLSKGMVHETIDGQHARHLFMEIHFNKTEVQCRVVYAKEATVV